MMTILSAADPVARQSLRYEAALAALPAARRQEALPAGNPVLWWGSRSRLVVTVVKASLQDHKVVAVDEMHQTVLVADPSRPGTGKQMTKWLGFADTCDRVSHRVADEPVDAPECASGSSKPERVVLPPVRCGDQPHLTMPCSSR